MAISPKTPNPNAETVPTIVMEHSDFFGCRHILPSGEAGEAKSCWVRPTRMDPGRCIVLPPPGRRGEADGVHRGCWSQTDWIFCTGHKPGAASGKPSWKVARQVSPI